MLKTLYDDDLEAITEEEEIVNEIADTSNFSDIEATTLYRLTQNDDHSSVLSSNCGKNSLNYRK